MIKPREVIGAVLSGSAATGLGFVLGFEPVPAVLLGLVVWATVHGTYRRNTSRS